MRVCKSAFFPPNLCVYIYIIYKLFPLSRDLLVRLDMRDFQPASFQVATSPMQPRVGRPQAPGNITDVKNMGEWRECQWQISHPIILAFFEGFEVLFLPPNWQEHFRHVDVSWWFCIQESLDRMIVKHVHVFAFCVLFDWFSQWTGNAGNGIPSAIFLPNQPLSCIVFATLPLFASMDLRSN